METSLYWGWGGIQIGVVPMDVQFNLRFSFVHNLHTHCATCHVWKQSRGCLRLIFSARQSSASTPEVRTGCGKCQMSSTPRMGRWLRMSPPRDLSYTTCLAGSMFIFLLATQSAKVFWLYDVRPSVVPFTSTAGYKLPFTITTTRMRIYFEHKQLEQHIYKIKGVDDGL